MSDHIELFKTRISNPVNQATLRKAVQDYSSESIDEFDAKMEDVKKFNESTPDDTVREIAAMLLKIKWSNINSPFGDILQKYIFAPDDGKPPILEDKLCPQDSYKHCEEREEGETYITNDFERRGYIGGRKRKTRKHKKKGKKKTMRKKGKKKTKKRKGKKKMKKRGKKKTMKKRGKKSRK